MPQNQPTDTGPYTPRSLLASGAQSQVWVADGPSGRVALKIARTPDHRAALAKEAAVHGLGPHPNLVPLLEAAPDHSWLALELVEGPTIDVWAQHQTIDTIVQAALRLLDALEHLHGHGVIHGDVKPSNVLVGEDGIPRLIDLGIASKQGEASPGFRGTLGYAAPELLRGEAPTFGTDVYGLGALLYSCITGRTPFVAPDPAALTYLPLVSLPPPPAAFVPDLPSTINQLLLALLARDPRRRPSDIGRLRDALAHAAHSNPPPPLLGMLEEREELRRAVVGAADGEPRIVILYGPPGAGRRTLIAEAVEYARREGLPYLKGSDPRELLQHLRRAKHPSVLVMRARSKAGRQLAEIVLKESLQCLLLLHSDRPVPSLVSHGAILLTPSPLQEQDAQRLARMFAVDSPAVSQWWRDTMGLPAAMLGRIRAWRRQEGLTETSTAGLPSESRKVIAALKAHPKLRAPVATLAAELKMSEHRLLDHCEVLFAEQLIQPLQDGEFIGIVTYQEGV